MNRCLRREETYAFTNIGKIVSADQKIVETVIEVNHAIKDRLVEKRSNLFQGGLKDNVICIFGVTF